MGLVNLIIAEQNQPTCDLLLEQRNHAHRTAAKDGLLQERSWNVSPTRPGNMIASDGTWCGFAARARVLIINKKLIPNPDDYPRSVPDLTNPKWKGKCAMARPLFGTTATHFAVLRELAGHDTTIGQLKAIRDNATILSGNKQVAMSVSAGSIAWGLTDTDDAIIEKDSGRPVEIIFPDQATDQPGTLRIPNTIAVIKNTEHPNAAPRWPIFWSAPKLKIV